MTQQKKISVFIMAGGKGERLHPLTRDRAKPAVPFGGIYRIIDFTLSNCVNSGLRRIYILSQYKSISLSRHIRQGWDIFSAELGEFVSVIPAQQRVDERWYQGTADAVYQNIYSIEMEKPPPDYILVLAGDHIYRMDYRYLIDFHMTKNADVTVGAVGVPAEASERFGIIELDHEEKMVGFQEKPKISAETSPMVFASMGIYIFKREVLEQVLTEDARQNSEHDFGKNIIPGMLKTFRVYGYNFRNADGSPCYWRDVGDIDSYYEANMDLVQISPEFNLYDEGWPLRTAQVQGPPAKTVFAEEKERGRIGVALNSLVCPGAVISGAKVHSSIISPHVRINSFAEVYDSIIMERVNIGRNAQVRRAIIDKDANIWDGAKIGYDLERDRKRFTVSDSGIAVVSKGEEVKE